jgi:hypothetical protein
MHARGDRFGQIDDTACHLQDLSFLLDDRVSDDPNVDRQPGLRPSRVRDRARPRPPRRLGQLDKMDQIVERAFAQLVALARQADRFFARFFAGRAAGPGCGHERAVGEQIRLAILSGDRSWMPHIQFAGLGQLGGAPGAYAAETGTVYLGTQVRSPRRAADVLMEALGHHLAARRDW